MDSDPHKTYGLVLMNNSDNIVENIKEYHNLNHPNKFKNICASNGFELAFINNVNDIKHIILLAFEQ